MHIPCGAPFTTASFAPLTIVAVRGAESAKRNDLVIIAMKDQRGNVDPFQVFGQIGFRERLDAEISPGESTHHALEPKGLADALGYLRALPVVTLERHAQVHPKLRPVRLNPGADLVERLDRSATGV